MKAGSGYPVYTDSTPYFQHVTALRY